MSWEQVLSIISIITAVIAIITSIFAVWLTYKLNQKQLQKEKAAVIAELFSKWIKYTDETISEISKEELSSYYEDLNRLSLEISLWIKDETLLNDIMNTLSGDTSQDVQALIVRVRKMVLENNKDKFDPKKITLWYKK